MSSRSRHLALGAVAIVAVLLPGLTTLGALVTTDRYIVVEGDTVTEDQYITSTSTQIEGVVEGDVTVFSGSLTITGEVTGSVTVFSIGDVVVAEGATIGGSLKGAVNNVRIGGTVDGDVFIGAAFLVVESTGVVGRDVMGFGGSLRVDGSVARDVRGRTIRTTISGSIGGDVDIATQGLFIEDGATIGGDVLYRSPNGAVIDPSAEVTGTVTRLPTQGNFLYGIILSLATVISFLGFLVAGIVALWLLRASSSRAVGAVLRRPIRSLLVGVFTVVVLPAAIVVLAVTLVGLPLAAVGALIGGVAFIIGPVPVVTALGNRVLLGRGALFGAFVVGAVLWRLGIWLIPAVGGFIYLIALVWGVGAWVLGLAAARRDDPTPAALLPASMIVHDEVPSDWEPPLAPIQPTTEAVPKPEGEQDIDLELELVLTQELQEEPEEEPEAEPQAAKADGDPEDDVAGETDSWGLPTH